METFQHSNQDQQQPPNNQNLVYAPSTSNGSLQQPDPNLPLLIHATGSPMEAIISTCQTIALSDATVIIQGETGCGKELIAQLIHAFSPRQNNPFIPMNCGAVPEGLMESELFGHSKGAFTGAIRNHRGRFALAESGTLFMDEVGEMPVNMQVKLLRVLQEKKYEPVGSAQSVNANIRIVCATNKDLWDMVQNSDFREDLYYRLNVVPINLPPLRERTMDIIPIAEHFREKANKDYGSNITGISAKAITVLKNYNWPGNVRELQNVICRVAAIKRQGVIEVDDLPHYLTESPEKIAGYDVEINEDGIDFKATIEQIERNLLYKALEKTGGNKNRAAQLLNVNRTTLVEKLKRLEQAN